MRSQTRHQMTATTRPCTRPIRTSSPPAITRIIAKVTGQQRRRRGQYHRPRGSRASRRRSARGWRCSEERGASRKAASDEWDEERRRRTQRRASRIIQQQQQRWTRIPSTAMIPKSTLALGNTLGKACRVCPPSTWRIIIRRTIATPSCAEVRAAPRKLTITPQSSGTTAPRALPTFSLVVVSFLKKFLFVILHHFDMIKSKSRKQNKLQITAVLSQRSRSISFTPKQRQEVL